MHNAQKHMLFIECLLCARDFLLCILKEVIVTKFLEQCLAYSQFFKSVGSTSVSTASLGSRVSERRLCL